MLNNETNSLIINEQSSTIYVTVCSPFIYQGQGCIMGGQLVIKLKVHKAVKLNIIWIEIAVLSNLKETIDFSVKLYSQRGRN